MERRECMKRKQRAIHEPELPENLEEIELTHLSYHDLIELSRIEKIKGPLVGEHVRFEEVYLKKVTLSQSRLSFSRWTDVIFNGCDLSNVDFQDAYFNRVAFHNCKLAGADFDQANFQDVQFIECEAPYCLFNQTLLRDMAFRQCLLKGANFMEVQFDNVQFGYSVIQDVTFTGSSLASIDLSNCQFRTIHLTGEELRGAIISAEQAVSFIELFGVQVKYDE
ncbi:pentapeptide repeat-containing protein [Virgibacillus massiliensis]|nr:pentapeptide repeat-containing protein [Virgibacillus massiliensis]